MGQIKLRDLYDIEQKRGMIEILERRTIVCLARIGMMSYHNIEERELLAGLFGEYDAMRPNDKIPSGAGSKLFLHLKTTQGTTPGKGTILLCSDKGPNQQAIIGFIVYSDSDQKQYFIDTLTKNGQVGDVQEL